MKCLASLLFSNLLSVHIYILGGEIDTVRVLAKNAMQMRRNQATLKLDFSIDLLQKFDFVRRGGGR